MGLPILEPPPRTIQPVLPFQMALAGPTTQIGWLFLGLGSIFFWVFAWHADLTGWRFHQGATATVNGAAVGCRETRYYVGRSRGARGAPVYENRYTYRVDGSAYSGQSYDTGNCAAGGPVMVEYLLSQPSYSRIVGMRRGLLSPWALLAAVFPAIGLLIAAIGLWRAPFRLRALRDGLPTAGLITASVPTGSRVMGRAVYRIDVEFKALDGSRRAATFTTNRPERLPDRQLTVLCDPDYSGRAVPLEALPGDLSLDPAGRIVPGGSRKFLLLPAATVLLNLWFASRVW